jgi:RNA polymerase sigma factor (sigma-70 family)
MTDPVPEWACEQFEEFYLQTFDRVLARARMLTAGGTRRSAEDLMHDAYVQALRHWAQALSGLAAPQRIVWMRTTMARLAAREHEQQKRFQACAAQLHQPDFSEASGSEAAALAALTWRQCWQKIQAMSQIEKSVSILCFVDGCSRAQAAEILGVPESTVRGALKRARDCLAERVGSQLDFEPRYGKRGREPHHER